MGSRYALQCFAVDPIGNPDVMRITYRGDGELVSEFGALLADEGLEVGYFTQGPAERTPGDDAVQVFKVKMPGDVPEWATTLSNAEVAVSKFRDQFPDSAATIEFDGERSDLNLPHAADYR
jgi:hypothetical protein